MPGKALYLYFRRFAPFASFGGGFEGDNRSHSTSLKATSRTSAFVQFTSAGVLMHSGHSSGSEWLIGSKEYGTVKINVSFKLARKGMVAFVASSAGSNPLVPGAPDIDTFVVVLAIFRPGELLITGQVNGDGFPHAEVFLRDSKGTARMLMEYSTSSGGAGPFHRLWGPHQDNVIGKFRTKIALNGDGSLGKVLEREPYKFTRDPGAMTFEAPRLPSVDEILDPRSWGL